MFSDATTTTTLFLLSRLPILHPRAGKWVENG